MREHGKAEAPTMDIESGTRYSCWKCGKEYALLTIEGQDRWVEYLEEETNGD